MRRIVFAIALLLGINIGSAQFTAGPDGFVCNFPPTGDESNQQAVPIEDFRTSGLDMIRPNWCITHCHDRKSLKATVNFLPANSSAPSKSIHRFINKQGKVSFTYYDKNGESIPVGDSDDDDFCIDPVVSDAVERVVQTYKDIDSMSEALNYYVNRPGWAFLIYDMGKPPTLISSENVKQDYNYCEKTVVKQLPTGEYQMFQVFSGMVQPDKN